MRLATRFFLSHALGIAVGVALCLGVLYVGGRSALVESQRKAEQEQLAALELAAHESALDAKKKALIKFMTKVMKDPAVALAVYVHPESKTRICRPKDQLDEALALLDELKGEKRSHIRKLDGKRVRFWVADVKLPGFKPGQVGLAYDLAKRDAELGEQLKDWARPALAALVAALLAGGLLAWLLARQLAKPLQAITHGIQQVRDGKRDHVIELKRKDEIGELARELDQMTQELKELDLMKRDFVNGVTHDLGTPLHTMRSAVNYLQAGKAGPLNGPQADYLLILSNAVEFLNQFIQNLLSVAKIEAGKVEPYATAFDPVEATREVLSLYEPQAQERGLELRLKAGDAPLVLMADRLQFKQMLLNLLTNALKFTDSGYVEVILQKEEHRLRVNVRDTGLGIAGAYHELIFDKFYRVRQPEGETERKGTGLGLSIARGLAEAHHGTLTVESELGQGSTFTLLLPGARQGRSE